MCSIRGHNSPEIRHEPCAMLAGGRRLAHTVENRYSVVPIRSNSGFIKPRSGPGHSVGSRLSAAKVTQLAGKFVNPDRSVLYPGGTSW